MVLDSSSTSCTGAGQGLSYDGSTFGCTAAYSWNLAATGVTGSQGIAAGGTATFAAGNGLTVGRSTSTVTYTVNLSASRGLVFNGSSIALPNCTTTGYVLKWNGSAYTCQQDKDTITQTSAGDKCKVWWSRDDNIDGYSYNSSFSVGNFVYYEIRFMSDKSRLDPPYPKGTVLGTLDGDNNIAVNKKCIPHSELSAEYCNGNNPAGSPKRGNGTGVDVETHVGTLVICNDGTILTTDNITRPTDIRVNNFFANQLIPTGMKQ